MATKSKTKPKTITNSKGKTQFLSASGKSYQTVREPQKTVSYTSKGGEKKVIYDDGSKSSNGSQVRASDAEVRLAKKENREPILITSGQGERVVDQTQKRIDTLKGSTITPEQRAQLETQLGEAQTKLDEYIAGGKTTKPTETPTQPEEVVTYINPETDQEVTLKGPAVTPENKAKYESQGYQPSTTTTSAGVPDPLEKVRGEMTTAANELSNLMGQLTETAITSKELASKTRGIRQRYNARIDAMQNVNERRSTAMNTLGIRLGSRYTGSSAGTMGSILSEEERQGIARITDIESQMQEAILSAEDAARNYNFGLYKEMATKAEEKYKEKVEAYKTLEAEQKAEDEKIEAEKTLIEQQTSIIEEIKGGEKDPMKIFASLGGKVPFSVIKTMTDTLPDAKPVVLGKSDTLVDPITGKVIARGVGEATTGGGGSSLITPVGTPVVAGVGSTYDNSSFEAQMLMDDIMNKIPVQLKNTEKEVALKYEQIRKQLQAGYSYQDIVDRLSGFSLQGKADPILGGALYDASLGTDIDVGQLASLLNCGADEQAMTTVENAKLSGAEGFYAQTDKARQTVDQANKVIRLLNEVPADKLGAFDGKVFGIKKQLTPAENLKVQQLQTAMDLLNAPLRVAISGTATTPTESEKIAGFQASILDQPSIIDTKVQELRDSVLEFHNQTRSQRGLPKVTTTELTDNQARLNVYRSMNAPDVTAQDNDELLYGSSAVDEVSADPNGIY